MGENNVRLRQAHQYVIGTHGYWLPDDDDQPICLSCGRVVPKGLALSPDYILPNGAASYGRIAPPQFVTGYELLCCGNQPGPV